MLFARIQYFLTNLTVFALYCRTIVKVFPMSKPAALISGLILVAFVQNCTPFLNYNTLGTAFLTLTVSFFIYACVLGKRPYGFGAATALVLASASYPPLALAGVFLLISLLWLYWKHPQLRGNLKKILVSAIIGGTLTSATLLAWLSSYGWESILESWEYSKLFNVFGSWEDKKWYFLFHWSHYQFGWGWAGGILALGMILKKWIPIEVGLVAAMTIVTAANWAVVCPSTTHILLPVMSVAFLGWYLWIYVRKEEKKPLDSILLATLASLVFLAPIIAWSSSVTISAMPVVSQVSAALGLFMYMNERNRGWILGLGTAVLFTVTAFFHFLGDDPFKGEIARIEKGPSKGIYTFKEKRDFFHEVDDSLKQIEKHGTNIMFNFYPQGYMQTGLKPHSRVLLMAGLEKPGVINSHAQFVAKYGPPDLYFELLSYPAVPGIDDVLDNDIRGQTKLEMRKMLSHFGTYALLGQHPRFNIWKLQSRK